MGSGLVMVGHVPEPGARADRTNVFSREIKEAVIGAANDMHSKDGNGAGGMRGYMRHLAMNNEAVFGGLLRGVMGAQVTVERQREAPAKTEQEVRDGLARIGIAAGGLYASWDFIRPMPWSCRQTTSECYKHYRRGRNLTSCWHR